MSDQALSTDVENPDVKAGQSTRTGHIIQVLKAEPSNREALLARAQAYLHLADLDMAKRHVGEALKYDPENQEAMAEFKKLKKLAKLQQQVRRWPLLTSRARASRICACVAVRCRNADAGEQQLQGLPCSAGVRLQVNSSRRHATCCACCLR